MLDLGSQMDGFALPLPAINNNFNHGVTKPKASRALPRGLKLVDLNYYSNAKSRLFTYPNALYSAEAAFVSRGGAVQRRDRSKSFLFMDSGGFGFIKGARAINTIVDLRRDALIAQEELADAGVIVDVPTACAANGIAGAETFDKCLALTLESIDYAQRYRTPGRIKLLNIIQGLDNGQVRRWYKGVMGAGLDGFGFAGARRKDMRIVLELVICMIRDREIGRGSWFHVFGTNHPGLAVFLTALQRQLRAVLGEGVRITFDSSTSYSVAQGMGMIVTGLRTDRYQIAHETYRVAKPGSGIDGSKPWPFGGPLGSRCSIEDFLPHTGGAAGMDTLGQLMLSSASAYAELASIIRANRLFDMEHVQGWDHPDNRLVMPWDLHQGVDAIGEAFEHVRAQRYDQAIAIARRTEALSAFSSVSSEAEEDER